MGSKTMPVETLRQQLIDKATTDKGFRASLIADPKTTIQAELDVKIPDAFDIDVLEDGPTKAYLVLPPSAELSEADLKQAAGGVSGSEAYQYFWRLLRDSLQGT